MSLERLIDAVVTLLLGVVRLESGVPSRGQRREALQSGIENAARELDIRFDDVAAYTLTSRGTLGTLRMNAGLEVRELVVNEKGEKAQFDFLILSIAGPAVPSGVQFSAEWSGPNDVLVGDTFFDDTVHLEGEVPRLLGVLDEPTRRRVAQFVILGGSLRHGEMRWEGKVRALSTQVPSTLKLMLDLARDMTARIEEPLAPRLAANAMRDPLGPVRLWNLLTLQETFPAATETIEACRHGLDDASAWVCLSAARFLGEEGTPALAHLVTRAEVPEQAAVEALGLLATRMEDRDALPIVLGLLKRTPGALRCRAIQELGRLGDKAALAPLIAVLGEADVPSVRAAATALGRLGDPAAEKALLKTLVNAEPELRVPCARALGAVGTVAAVEPLLDLANRRRLGTEARAAIREAVSAIQSRLAGAGAGQVTIAGTDATEGRVSLAAPQPGEGDVSLVDRTPNG